MISGGLSRANSIADLRLLAKRRVPKFVFEYIDGGVEDEVTLRRNTEIHRAFAFMPRTLVGTEVRSTAVSLFDTVRQTPLIIAPTGFNGLAYYNGDTLLAKAAAGFHIPFTLSSFSNQTLEEVSKASQAPLWFQLYVMRDTSIVDGLLARAEAAGCEALVLTTDANVQSLRERQRRCYRKPGSLSFWHALECSLHPHWVAGVVRNGTPTFANLRQYLSRSQASAAAGAHFVASQLKASLSWHDVARIRSQWPRKLIIKGILHPDDALRAVDVGADGIVLSNHGGRQLEGAVTALEVLPRVRRALGDAYPLIVDGGFTRGRHVINAVALGATAVMLGRATLYGLAARGQAGASHAITLLLAEIERNLAMLGYPSLAALTPGGENE